MPPPERHSGTILVPAQKLLVSSMAHSAVASSQVVRVPTSVGSSNPAVGIGRVVETHRTPPAAQVLAGQSAAPAALSVPPANLILSPAKAQVVKRLRVSNDLSLQDGLSNLPDDGIGKVVGRHLTLPNAPVLAAQVGAPAAPPFSALPADLLSPAKAKATKRLRASSKQDMKHVADAAEAGRATHQKNALHRAERMGLSLGTNDFKSDD